MNSKQIKQAFAEAGIKVRVAAKLNKFRVCTLGDAVHDQEASKAVAVSLGFVDCFGKPGGNFNQLHEMSLWIPRK